MDFRMCQVECFINNDNEIVIAQEFAGETCGSSDAIVLHPDQIDTVISWLQKLKKEALKTVSEN